MEEDKRDMSSSSQEDQDDIIDDKYTSSEQEQEEEEDKHEIFYNGDKVEDQSMYSSKKSYKGNFSSIKEEAYACPYGACGRKFVSAGQLKQHVERRHAPNIPKKTNT